MPSLNFKNIKVNGSTENMLAKLWLVITGAPLSRDAVDALLAFKAQDENWNALGALINAHLTVALASHGGDRNAYLKELFTNAGTTFTDDGLAAALTYFSDKGIESLLEIVVTTIVDPQAPGYSNLTQRTSTQATNLLVMLGWNNEDPAGGLVIQGVAREDATLAVVSTLADADGIPTSGANAIKFQWLSNGQAILGATASTLRLDQIHVGTNISVKATWTDNGGTTESVTSTATAAVANVNDAPTGSVTVSGTARVGQVLTAANTLTDADGIPTSGANALQYQWLANGQAISGATASSLTLDQAHVGKTIAVKAQYTDNFGTAESVTSTATAAVTPPPDFGRMEPVTAINSGLFGNFDDYVNREEGTFAEYVRGMVVQREGWFFDPVGRVLSFDGQMLYQAEGRGGWLDFISASVDLPIYDPTGMQENVTLQMNALVLDFANGPKHAVIDIAPRVYAGNEYWVILKNFEADDRLSFGIKATDRDAGGIVGSYLNKPLTIASTGHFSSLDDYYQSGRSLLESQSLGRVNAAFLPDARFEYRDSDNRRILDGIATAADFRDPENLELRSVGALVLDVNAYTPHSNGLPGYETYTGMGADGLTDLVISFVGSMPDFSQINLAGTTLFG